jgi:squalene cyclase
MPSMSRHGAADDAIQRALQFLEAHYRTHQSWCDFSTPKFGSSTVWVTAYVAYCLSEGSLDTPSLAEVLAFIEQSQLEDGGWGWGPPAPSDCDTTSICALLFSRRSTLDQGASRRILEFLEHHQREGGGFTTFHDYRALKAIPVYHNVETQFRGWCAVHNSVSAAALQAMVALGAPPTSVAVSRGIEFLREARRPDGLWNCYWWTAPYYPTLQVARAVKATRASGEIDMAPAIRALLAMQREDGAWAGMDRSAPCPFSTSMAIRTLSLSRGAPVEGLAESLARGERWLVQAQTDAGSWISPKPIMRVPHRDELDPDRNSELKPDGEKLKTDIFHVFTTANVCAALRDVARGT